MLNATNTQQHVLDLITLVGSQLLFKIAWQSKKPAFVHQPSQLADSIQQLLVLQVFRVESV